MFSLIELKKKKFHEQVFKMDKTSRMFIMILSELLKYLHIIWDTLECFPEFYQPEPTMNSTACSLLLLSYNHLIYLIYPAVHIILAKT